MLETKNYASRDNQVVLQPEHDLLLAIIDGIDSEGNCITFGIQPIGLESPWR